jgi:hypothetical protein
VHAVKSARCFIVFLAFDKAGEDPGTIGGADTYPVRNRFRHSTGIRMIGSEKREAAGVSLSDHKKPKALRQS